MQPGGKTVVDLVLEADGLLESRRAHDAEHRSEELGEVEVTSGGDAGADAGRPQPPALVERLRLEQPALPRLKLGQPPLELAVRGLDDRTHLARRVARVADAQGRRGVHELLLESLGAGDRPDEDDEARRRALLARVAEGALDDVGDREVEVG